MNILTSSPYSEFILKTGKKILFVNTKYVKKIIDMDKEDSDEILNKVFTH